MNAIKNNFMMAQGNSSLSLDLSWLNHARLSDRRNRLTDSLIDSLNADAGLNSLLKGECFC